MAVGNEDEMLDQEVVDQTTDDSDPEDEAEEGGEDEEEDEDEEDLIDPLDAIRESCEEKPECMKIKAVFASCEERVSGKSKTTETCAQELLDFIHCRDECASKVLFSKLK